jgi:hypothetical protein
MNSFYENIYAYFQLDLVESNDSIFTCVNLYTVCTAIYRFVKLIFNLNYMASFINNAYGVGISQHFKLFGIKLPAVPASLR